MRLKITLFLAGTLSLGACMTYYQRQAAFQSAFQQGDLPRAEKELLSDEKGEKRKTRLLYYLDRGVVHSLMGNYELSNTFLEKAWLLTEDYQKNIGEEALALFSNPNASEYHAEDHEALLINFYKALNYLKLNELEKALVEVRRMNIRLNRLEDKYKGKAKYRDEPFIENMMGLVYDASGETNNAFIAYRNAYEGYKKSSKVGVPMQLKKDLLRTASSMGFVQEQQRLEQEMNMKAEKGANSGSRQLVMIWMNGLSPVKSEWSLNFTVQKGQSGSLTFVNDQFGYSFPAVMQNYNPDQRAKLTDLEVVRVAFPKYVERVPFFSSATVDINGKSYSLEQAMNVNAVAFQCLEQRMVLEVGKAITRLALKQALQYAVKEGTTAAAKGDSKNPQNQQKAENIGDLAGFAIGVMNAVTEKADTRAWMTLPHSISYTRVPLERGEQTLMLKAFPQNGGNPSQIELRFTGKDGVTWFHSYHHLQSRNSYPMYR
jgi:uncharacterized protein